MLNITDRKVEEGITPVLRLGFRPFFLLGSLYAIVAIGLWVWMFRTGAPSQLSVPPLWWHVHEMMFGFGMAIVAGFVLTAVQNWTGILGVKSYRLGWLVTLWLMVRVLFWTPAPLWLVATIEAAFLTLTAFEVGSRVFKAKGWRNLFFVPLFLLAIAANFASYATIKGVAPFSASVVWQAMLWWFALLLSVMGGRVIPFFTARRLEFSKPQPLLWLEWLSNLPLIGLFILSFFPLSYLQLAPTLMLSGGLFQLARVLRWRPWLTLKEPLLWSLQLSYLCLPISLVLRGAWDNLVAQHALIHLFAIGTFGGVILSMIARVTMGHTGRAIYQGPSMSLAFAAIIAAALFRSLGTALYPELMLRWIELSAGLWVLAFSLFVVKFARMLYTPRVDGHPG